MKSILFCVTHKFIHPVHLFSLSQGYNRCFTTEKHKLTKVNQNNNFIKTDEKWVTLTVPQHYNDMRVDKFIMNFQKESSLQKQFQFRTLPHSFLQKLLREGKIKHNSKKLKKPSTHVFKDDTISIPKCYFTSTNTSDKIHIYVEKPKIKLTPTQEREVKSWVLFKNEEIIVINKPSGIAVQGGPKQTIYIDGILDVLKFDPNDDPKLVHRLDKVIITSFV